MSWPGRTIKIQNFCDSLPLLRKLYIWYVWVDHCAERCVYSLEVAVLRGIPRFTSRPLLRQKILAFLQLKMKPAGYLLRHARPQNQWHYKVITETSGEQQKLKNTHFQNHKQSDTKTCFLLIIVINWISLLHLKISYINKFLEEVCSGNMQKGSKYS